jgi:hypothetical protein
MTPSPRSSSNKKLHLKVILENIEVTKLTLTLILICNFWLLKTLQTIARICLHLEIPNLMMLCNFFQTLMVKRTLNRSISTVKQNILIKKRLKMRRLMVLIRRTGKMMLIGDYLKM